MEKQRRKRGRPFSEQRRFLGARIREERERMDLSLSQLGDLVGMGKQNICHIELGRRPVSTGQLLAIAAALGIDPASLMEHNPVRLALGTAIRLRREKLKITRPEMNAKLDFKRNEIAEIEAGRRGCSIDLLVEIAAALDTKPRDLLKGLPSPMPPNEDN